MRSRNARRLRAATLVALLALGAARSGAESRIVNGVLTSDYPSTGALLYSGGGPASSTTASSWCSGTLIGCETFLTAAHCVEDDPTANAYIVFLQHAGFFSVSSIAIHPDYPSADATGDVAILELGTPVLGITPTPLGDSAVPASTPGTIAGFGQSGGLVGDYGLKRAGAVVTETCGVESDDATSVCWLFSEPQGPPGSNSNTCNGDSGGPLFVDGACGLELVGVTSFGTSSDCLPDDLSVDASVDGHRSFILAEGGTDLSNTTCGSGSQVGDANSTLDAFTGTVSSGSPEAFHSFVVGAGVSSLRVALNAIDNGVADFDLYVRRGSAPTTSVFDCAHTGANQYGYCEFASPIADTWHVLVRRVTGSGTYQVTATTLTATLGSFPSDGSSCDDDNSCTNGETCGAEHCSGGSALPDATPCDDGTICTPIDECESGVCGGNASPRATCKAPPGRSTLQILDRAGSSQDKINWKWLKGPQTTLSELEDPRDGAPDYTLCVYDETASGHTLAVDATAPGGGACQHGNPCWKEIGSDTSPKGYKYTDSLLTPDGLSRVQLVAGDNDKAKVTVTGKGANLGLPGPVSGSAYFDQNTSVTAQLVQADGDCWSASFASAITNQPDQFKAVCGTPISPCN